MSTTRWIDLLHASLASNFAAVGHPAKYVQLATCAAVANPTPSSTSLLQATAWAAPRVRTVVFRGIVANGQAHLADDWIKTSRPELSAGDDFLIQLLFVTDLRTHKVEELKENPLTEVCWYFPHSREQFRLSGVGTIVDGSSASAEPVTGAADAEGGLRATSIDWRCVRKRLWAAQSPAAKQTYLDAVGMSDRSVSNGGGDGGNLAAVSRHFGLLYVTVNHVDHLDLKSPASQESTVWSMRQGHYYALRSTL